MLVTPMSIEQFRAFVNSQNWIFAKTMPQFPHEYCLRRDFLAAGGSDTEFEAAVLFIYVMGKKEYFFGQPRKYYYLQEAQTHYRYWCMNSSPQETILINRTTDLRTFGVQRPNTKGMSRPWWDEG